MNNYKINKTSLHKKSYCAFTLAEVLIALAIVGVVAVLVIPALVHKVTNRILANQIKNMSAMLEQLAQDELVANQTRDLTNTDFADAAKLLTSKHFSITKSCDSSQSASEYGKCFSIEKYKTINGTKLTRDEIYTADDSSSGYDGEKGALILTNGVLLEYAPYSHYDESVGRFFIDVNGKDKPNVIGKDVFAFYVTPKGTLRDHMIPGGETNDDLTEKEKITACKAGNAFTCFGALRTNNWKMPY